MQLLGPLPGLSTFTAVIHAGRKSWLAQWYLQHFRVMHLQRLQSEWITGTAMVPAECDRLLSGDQSRWKGLES